MSFGTMLAGLLNAYSMGCTAKGKLAVPTVGNCLYVGQPRSLVMGVEAGNAHCAHSAQHAHEWGQSGVPHGRWLARAIGYKGHSQPAWCSRGLLHMPGAFWTVVQSQCGRHSISPLVRSAATVGLHLHTLFWAYSATPQNASILPCHHRHLCQHVNMHVCCYFGSKQFVPNPGT